MKSNTFITQIEGELENIKFKFLYEQLIEQVENLYQLKALNELHLTKNNHSLMTILKANNISFSQEDLGTNIALEDLAEEITWIVKQVVDAIGPLPKKILNRYRKKDPEPIEDTSESDTMEIIYDEKMKIKLPHIKEHHKIVEGFKSLLGLYVKASGNINVSLKDNTSLDSIFAKTNGALFDFSKITYAENHEGDIKHGSLTMAWTPTAKKLFEQVGLVPDKKAEFKPAKIGLVGKLFGVTKEEGKDDQMSLSFTQTFWENIEAIPAAKSGYTNQKVILKALQAAQDVYELYKKAVHDDIITKKLKTLEEALNHNSKSKEEKVLKDQSLLIIRVVHLYDLTFRVLIQHFFYYYETFFDTFISIFED